MFSKYSFTIPFSKLMPNLSLPPSLPPSLSHLFSLPSGPGTPTRDPRTGKPTKSTVAPRRPVMMEGVRSLPLPVLKQATGHFSPEHKLAQDPLGGIYMGDSKDGKVSE